MGLDAERDVELRAEDDGTQFPAILVCERRPIDQRPRPAPTNSAQLPDEKGSERDGDARLRNRGQFKPGSNSHTGEVFRRSKDRIPRTSTKLMLAIVQLDRREAIYQGLCDIAGMARKKPFAFLKLVEIIGDRTEGKPRQHIVAERRGGAIFMRDDTPAPPPEDTVLEGRPAAETPAFDLASPVCPVLPAQPLAIMPPPPESLR